MNKIVRVLTSAFAVFALTVSITSCGANNESEEDLPVSPTSTYEDDADANVDDVTPNEPTLESPAEQDDPFPDWDKESDARANSTADISTLQFLKGTWCQKQSYGAKPECWTADDSMLQDNYWILKENSTSSRESWSVGSKDSPIGGYSVIHYAPGTPFDMAPDDAQDDPSVDRLYISQILDYPYFRQ